MNRHKWLDRIDRDMAITLLIARAAILTRLKGSDTPKKWPGHRPKCRSLGARHE